MLSGVTLQNGVSPLGGSPVAILVTLLIATVFYAVTLHLAAVFFLGDVPSQRAAYVAPIPAVTTLLVSSWHPLVILAMALLGDFIGIRLSYKLDFVPAGVLTALHFAFATVLAFALNNIFGFV